jgi:FkbM family methyltransferase
MLLKNIEMKKIFIDCGTHYGQGIKSFKKKYRMDDSWQIFTWEANPYTYKKFLESEIYRTTKINCFNSAVTDYNGTIELNIETVEEKNTKIIQNTGQGTSIIPLNDWASTGSSHNGQFLETISVPCIDISEWICLNCNKNDTVIVKLDVEGAEYSILKKILEDKSYEFITAIYIEWHSRFFSNPEQYKIKEKQIINELTLNGVRVESWI